MSAEIISLKRARKAKQRRAAATRAEQNRAKFGRTKAAVSYTHLTLPTTPYV